MEDLSSEMKPGKRISPKMRDLLNKEKVETRKRIIERGIVHFRADKEFMTALLDKAEQLKIAPGTLCRHIVWEQLKSSRSEPFHEVDSVGFSAEQSNALAQKLESIQELLAQAVGSRNSTSVDKLAKEVARLVRELKCGQDEIRDELKQIYGRLLGPTKRAKRQ